MRNNDQKKIIITGGPTNEPIDEVMKITNMSTGSLSVNLTNLFLDAGWQVCLVLNNGVSAEKLKIQDASTQRQNHLKLVRVETTDEMLSVLEAESKQAAYDVVIHASAVGDYKAAFSFLLEDLAEELFANKDCFKSAEDILKMMENPKCKLDDSSKISSYQKNLTVKLGLTPKIIARLREWYPNSILIGCKLLESVPKEELYEVSSKLCSKNDMDYILANDLAELKSGIQTRYLVTKIGFTGIKLEAPHDIFDFVSNL